jgi:hypothetical protein
MRGLAGAARVIAKGDPLPNIDFHCPLPSLPLAFRTGLSSIPARIPYLPAPPAPKHRGALAGKRLPKIGLAWAGNAKHARDRERSMRLRDLLPLLDIDATFVSLQREVRPGDRATLQGCDMIQPADIFGDFSDTAALISQLDIVISVDTSIAHLAGALGKPVWILLTHIPDWRWLLDRDDSPWYPTARLFRQCDRREWGSMVERVRDALHQFTRNPGILGGGYSSA